jgi:hypothetical protein
MLAGIDLNYYFIKYKIHLNIHIGSIPRNKGMLTRTGVGRFTLTCKSFTGVQQEWKLHFCKWGCIMVSEYILVFLVIPV